MQPPRRPSPKTPKRGGARPPGARPAARREREQIAAALSGEDVDVVVHVDGHDVALTSLDRVYWPAEPALRQPALTKRDFLLYLLAVAPALLPHVADRPMTIFRWPEGIAARRVLQKHWEIKLPTFVERVTVFSEAKDQTDQYILCNNLATLLWLGLMGALELHVWHSRVRAGRDA
jgi:bifunctional non-homologous end joining protein LigD